MAFLYTRIMGVVKRGRPPLADAERRECVWTTRLTADEAAALEVVFEGMGLSRSDGLRALALTAARAEGGRVSRPRRVSRVRPAGGVTAAELARERVEDARDVPAPEPELVVPEVVFRQPGQCPPHPKRRVLKGLCGACGRPVGSERVA